VVHAKYQRRLILRFNKEVILIDRPRLEEHLLNDFLDLGHVKLSDHVTNVTSNGIVSGRSGSIKYDIVIIAEGARGILSKNLGLCDPMSDYLNGIQALIQCRNSLERPIVITDERISMNFFAWVVPRSENELLVGLADRGKVLDKIKHLIKNYIPMILGDKRDYKLIKYFGGIIPLSQPCRPVLGNIIGVGDAVSMIKPISGGGLYSISIFFEAMQEMANIEDVKSIDQHPSIQKLINELKTHHLIRKIITKIGGHHRLIEAVIKSGVNEVRLKDYDKLEIDGSTLLKVAPAILTLLKPS
jgi:hypothetical protein